MNINKETESDFLRLLSKELQPSIEDITIPEKEIDSYKIFKDELFRKLKIYDTETEENKKVIFEYISEYFTKTIRGKESNIKKRLGTIGLLNLNEYNLTFIKDKNKSKRINGITRADIKKAFASADLF